jgi:uncharacterized protein YhaN
MLSAKRPEGEEINDGEVSLKESRLIRAQEATRTLSAELNQLIGNVKATGNGLFDKVSLLTERVAALSALEKTLENEALAWDLLRTVLQEERQKMVDAVIDPVKQKMEPWVSALTGGRYTGVELDRKDLRPVGLTGDDIELLVASEISTGTSEQLALLARLSLACLLAGAGRQVIVLDDPLVNTDPDRQRAAWGIVREAARDIQIVVLTCHPVPPAVAEAANVIDFPA